MPHPYVDRATVAGSKITLRVEVTDFGPSGGYVSVSGQATQVGGALAVINATVAVPAAPNGDGADAGSYFVDVTADTIGPYKFRKDQNISVYVTVGRNWLTVLGKDPAPVPDQEVTAETAIPPGTTWDLVRADARFDGSEPPAAAAGQS